MEGRQNILFVQFEEFSFALTLNVAQILLAILDRALVIVYAGAGAHIFAVFNSRPKPQKLQPLPTKKI